MRYFKSTLAALGAALLVAACGGGGSEPLTSSVGITSVKVMGDSLSDSGVFQGIPGFGRTFTIQEANEPTVIWTERTAAVLGAPQLCPVYKFTGSTFALNPVAGCTSFAVGGGRINNPASGGGAASPVSILKQLADAGAAGGYKASDLLLIDGGANDAADLVGAYLKAPTDGGATYAALLGTILPASTVGTTLASANGAETAGGLYMKALADVFYNAIKAQALDKGAARIAILNIPGITNTPRFQLVLDSIAAAYGGGTAGATARAQAEAVFRAWIVAFNQQIAARAAGDARVVVVDFYTNLDNQMAAPAQYGLTNVKTPACPVTGIGSDGLPSYNFQTCTATALSAQTPPAGATGGADWWKTYGFSDGFHPSPYGHQLMGQLVAKSLAAVGWL